MCADGSATLLHLFVRPFSSIGHNKYRFALQGNIAIESLQCGEVLDDPAKGVLWIIWRPPLV